MTQYIVATVSADASVRNASIFDNFEDAVSHAKYAFSVYDQTVIAEVTHTITTEVQKVTQ